METIITKQQIKNAIKKGWELPQLVKSIENKHGLQSMFFWFNLSEQYTKLKEVNK